MGGVVNNEEVIRGIGGPSRGETDQLHPNSWPVDSFKARRLEGALDFFRWLTGVGRARLPREGEHVVAGTLEGLTIRSWGGHISSNLNGGGV